MILVWVLIAILLVLAIGGGFAINSWLFALLIVVLIIAIVAYF